MTFSQSILKKISTNNTKKPDSPQIIIENPLDDETFVNGIELILSPEFSKKGKLLIEINDIAEFDANDSESFDGYAKFPIPLSKLFKRGHDIRIFAWNGTDTNVIKMSLNTSISKSPEPFNSQAVPLGKDVFNRVVSESEIIIPVDDYLNESVPALLDMQGYKKLILIMSAQNYTGPTVLSGALITDIPNSVDGDLGTFAISASIPIASLPLLQSFDFGSKTTRNIRCKCRASTGLGALEGFLEVSDDDISYSVVDSSIFSSGGPEQTLQSDGDSFRYARFRIEDNSATGTATMIIYEMYDNNFFGGTAEVSFNVLDTASNTFRELISASDIGSITQGQAKVITIGDVINDLALNKFNFALPSTQTGLQLILTVTNGGINTGVSIIRVD